SIQADRGEQVLDVDSAADSLARGAFVLAAAAGAALCHVRGDAAGLQSDGAPGCVQPAPGAVTAWPGCSRARHPPSKVAIGAPAADGRVVLDGAALQRQRTAGKDAPARSSTSWDGVSPEIEAIAATGGVVLHGHAIQDQGALVMNSPS